MNRKLAVLLIVVTLLFAACDKSNAPPASSGGNIPPAAGSSPPVSPLPPVEPRDEPPELPPLPSPESSPEPEPVGEPRTAAPAPQESADVLGEAGAPGLSSSVPPETGFDAAKVEAELLRLINLLRLEAAIEPLGLEEQMQAAARIRSDEALVKFSHTRPDETPYNTAFDEAEFDYSGKWHGENLASLTFPAGMLDEKAAALELFEGLKESPGHRENMARGNFAQVGIGVSVSIGEESIKLASAQLFASF